MVSEPAKTLIKPISDTTGKVTELGTGLGGTATDFVSGIDMNMILIGGGIFLAIILLKWIILIYIDYNKKIKIMESNII